LGDLFTSFEDAWAAFLTRDEPLEDFFDQFPNDDEHVIEGWLVEPSPSIKAAATDLQMQLARVDSLVAIPDDFLHVWIGTRELIGSGWRAWSDMEHVAISYARVNCFHTAVVVELDSTVRRLVVGTRNDVPTFLPHLTIAVVREPSAPEPFRQVLRPLRDARLGSQDVQEVKLVRVPASKTTVLRPWTVLQTVAFGVPNDQGAVKRRI
jgi:hypothetical protein